MAKATKTTSDLDLDLIGSNGKAKGKAAPAKGKAAPAKGKAAPAKGKAAPAKVKGESKRLRWLEPGEKDDIPNRCEWFASAKEAARAGAKSGKNVIVAKNAKGQFTFTGAATALRHQWKTVEA